MDSRFEPYFRARVEQIGREDVTRAPREEFALGMPAQGDTFEAAVFSAVERGMDKTAVVRPDGQLLLHLAFTELVAEPMRSVRWSDADLNDVLEAIEMDVRKITQEALAERGHGEPLSAHDIVNATSRSWSELRTAGFDLWD